MTTKPTDKGQSEHQALTDQWARAATRTRQESAVALKGESLNQLRRRAYERRWRWTVAFWLWLLFIHAGAIWLFASGFLLTRLVLQEKSDCGSPPANSSLAALDVDGGCWHPKTFDRAVVIVIDALRYDFTVPTTVDSPRHFHNALPFLHASAAAQPGHAFLRPFIADPPTTTLQRLKGLTTGTLPTFVDAGSNFAGTAIEEDNLLMQLRRSGKKIAHLGDDTWWSLFPGYFEANISRAYDSFNVWDLHTVDDGVMDKIFPLLEKGGGRRWDLLIGHCLGVDHAGHRYGPDHPAMEAKLRQMDDFVRRLTAAVDDDTLLVVMGDHGMDAKGDHGGESDDEVEAALWMYSKRPVFGRTSPEHATPPATAKIRPVNQIDLVPTLALLLGIPIPYNSLGRPIEEAFASTDGGDWANLAAVSRMSAAGIERYQKSYFAARGVTPDTQPGSPADLWARANAGAPSDGEAYQALVRFQERTLQVCKGLWARFDVPRMVAGVFVAAAGVVMLALYASRGPDDEYVVAFDVELDYAERKLELAAFRGEAERHPDQSYHRHLLRGMWNIRFIVAAVSAAVVVLVACRERSVDGVAAMVMTLMLATVGLALHRSGKTLANLVPRSVWGCLSVVFCVGHSVGFASNSYTVWEDSILLFSIATFGAVAAVASFRIENRADRALAVYHCVAFVALGRLASYSKLCREEQMPYCTSTYYASAASSTSAPWQLAVPFAVFAVLPSVVKSFLRPTRSYEGLAPTWIGYVFRTGLFMSAVYWVIDAADNGDWFARRLPDGTVKAAGVYLAQLGLALFLVAGTTAFTWAPPCLSVVSAGQSRVAILGYANALGARYLLLPLNVLGACLVVTKPMGGGALALMLWQVLSLAEVVDLNGLKAETTGPVVLAMLGNFYFFRTGHQAALSSIQWDSAFVPLFTIRYPWSPLVVTLNTFAGQVLAASCVPLVALWKAGPKQKGVLETVARAAAAFVGYYAVEALATMTWAGWLRRHLMLYRVFSPRFMMAAVLLLVLDLVVLLVSLTGLRTNMLSVSEVFGWAE
ncbi:hypothetical protein XA68_16494 [Ophiocordyceps unilateralis]|uniref:Uncharacterized protein n=1 Tax=Ophiocordyceps unilateralis TaxID=268505 RepID=A0A2A9P630_OPHUN|nr:hypothetical protein XA68_16494 [Ophiocordyceps unilateralis]